MAFTNINDVYTLWFDTDTKSNDSGECEYRSNTPNGLGGNCETAARIVAGQYAESTNLLADLISSETIDATVSDTNFVGTVIAHLDNDDIILAELVTDKTANFYLFSWGETNSYTKLTSASWSYQTPAGLGEGEQVVVVPIPDAVLAEGDFDRDERTFIFAKDQGYIRKGNFVAAGTVSAEADDWVFNSVANDNILAAVDFDFLDALEVTGNSESDWDNNSYATLGGPVTGTEYTYKAFDRSVSLARAYIQSITEGVVDFDIKAEDVSGLTFYESYDESITFNTDGTGSGVDGQDTFTFTWTINEEGYLINNFGDAIVENGYTFSAADTFAAIAEDPETGDVTLKAFFKNSLWQQIGPDGGDPVISKNQGEIWGTVWKTTRPQEPQ